MKGKLVVFGTSMLSTMMQQIIDSEGFYEVVAFTVDKEYMNESTLSGLPVVPFEEIEEYFNMKECEILLTIGYTKLNEFRKMVYDKCKLLGYRICTYVSPKAIVYSNKIGEGSIVMPTVFIGPDVVLGVGNILNFNVCVSHNIKIGDFNFFAGGVMLGGEINVGCNCFIGLNCTLRNGIKVSDKTLIGANIYMDKNTLSQTGYINTSSSQVKLMDSEILIDFV